MARRLRRRFFQDNCAQLPSPEHNPVLQLCAVCKIIIGDPANKTVDVDLADILAYAERCQVCSLLMRSLID